MAFRSTIWTQIGRAQQGSREALEEILGRYRPALIEYLRFRGLSDPDADDVVQEVCLEMCGEGFLARADRTKGRFRSLLLRVTQNVLNSQLRRKYAAKRGGGAAPAPLEEAATKEVTAQEERFNVAWSRNLVRLALGRMRDEDSRARAPYAELLELRFVEDLSPAEIASRLGMDRAAVDRQIHRGKQRLRRHLTEITGEYSSSEEEHTEDLELSTRYVDR